LYGYPKAGLRRKSRVRGGEGARKVASSGVIFCLFSTTATADLYREVTVRKRFPGLEDSRARPGVAGPAPARRLRDGGRESGPKIAGMERSAGAPTGVLHSLLILERRGGTGRRPQLLVAGVCFAVLETGMLKRRSRIVRFEGCPDRTGAQRQLPPFSSALPSPARRRAGPVLRVALFGAGKLVA